MRKRYLAMLWLAVLGIAGGLTPAWQPARVVASINGEAITEAAFEAEVAIQHVRNDLTGRGEGVSRPAIFNRLIGDVLLLQAARQADVTVDEGRVQSELSSLLRRHALDRPTMDGMLARRGLTWPALERSVRSHMTMDAFMRRHLLAGVAVPEREAALERWMAEQYREAIIRLDDGFVERINQERTLPAQSG